MAGSIDRDRIMNIPMNKNSTGPVLGGLRHNGDVQTVRIKGQPIIQGYANKRFDLNENLNVVQLLKRIDDLEARIAALESP